MSALAVEEHPAPPRFVHVPPRDGSLLRAVTGVAGKVGRSMDAAQATAVDVLTSSWADGRPAALEAAVVSSRQNLKTYCMENVVLARLLAPGPASLIVWSAHEVSTAQETFRSFIDLSERFDWLGRRVQRISRATGREEIEFTGGSRLRFKARINTGGRGLAGDVVGLDEAFALKPEHMGSLLPILSTKRRALVLYGSSAPLASSSILWSVIRRGRAGGAGAPAYVEWSAPGSLAEPGCLAHDCQHAPGAPGCVLDDEDLWRQANPAIVAGRIALDYVRAERRALPPEEFARERLGWGDPEQASAAPVDVTRWGELADPGSTPLPSPVVLAFDVSPGSRSAAVVAAGWRADGIAHVEVLAHRPGVAWLPEFVAGKQAATGGRVARLGGTAPGAGLDVPGAEDLGAAEYAAACNGLQVAVREGSLRHLGDPILLAALTGAGARDVGDGSWTFLRRTSSVDICPIVAAAVALRVLSGTPEASDIF